MKKFFIICICALLGNLAFCQSVGFISSDKKVNTYETKEDFSNTFEINFAPLIQVKPGQKHISYEASKCQAVRLNKSWFITAAHCVENMCEQGCSFQTRLLVDKNYEIDIISQSTKKSPQIFIHPGRNAKKNMSTYDIALVYFKPLTSKYDYKDPKTKRGISEKDFFNRLKNYTSYKQAINSYNTPTLIIMGANRKQGPIYARQFSVLSSFTDERKVLKSKGKAIYQPETKTFVLENFGIRQGISGSGLMTSKGELAGITSTISTQINNDKNQLAQFAAFDTSTLKFIEDKAGKIPYTYIK